MTQKPQGYGSACLNFSFEAAHRQPEVGGKCRNVHGHTFNVTVTLYNESFIGGVNPGTGLSVEFSEVKGVIRRWIDRYFDHGILLGMFDPLTPVMGNFDVKVYTFGEDGDYEGLPWPSVEAVAHCLGEKLQQALTDEIGTYVVIEQVTVSETATNTYVWNAPVVRTLPAFSLMPGEKVVQFTEVPTAQEPCG